MSTRFLLLNMNSSPSGGRDESGAYSSTTCNSSFPQQHQQELHDYSHSQSHPVKEEHITTATALSPPPSLDTTMGYDPFEEPLHRSQGSGDDDDDDDDGDDDDNSENEEEDSYDQYSVTCSDQQLSSSPQNLRSYAPYAEPPPPVLPPSPMVTPPATRGYERSAVVMEPKPPSLGASNFKQQTAPSSSGTGAAAATAVTYESHPTIATALGVPHVYRDHSQVPDDGSFIRKRTGGVTKPFPEKLHEMLGEVERTDASGIVGWLPHGRAFIVRKPKDFTGVLMPKYFKQTKLTSFQRQLNLYGFRRLTQGLDSGAYYHEMFLKARPVLCQRMARQKVKGTGHKQPADAKTEPNFYEMRPADEAAVAGLHTFYIPDGGCSSQSPSLSPSTSLYDEMNTTVGSMSTTMIAPPTQSESAVGSYSYPSPAWTFRQPPPGTILSPASPGLHGAAHMLQNIASGNSAMSSSLRMPSEGRSLGPPAMEANSTNHDDGPEDDPSSTDTYTPNEKRPAASFLQPRLSSPFDFPKP